MRGEGDRSHSDSDLTNLSSCCRERGECSDGGCQCHKQAAGSSTMSRRGLLSVQSDGDGESSDSSRGNRETGC
jgi:hypothetical protein